MNYKRHIILFNVVFLVLLLLSSMLFEWKPGIAGKNIKPIEIVSEVKKVFRKKKTALPNQSLKKSLLLQQQQYKKITLLTKVSSAETIL